MYRRTKKCESRAGVPLRYKNYLDVVVAFRRTRTDQLEIFITALKTSQSQAPATELSRKLKDESSFDDQREGERTAASCKERNR